MAVECFAHVSFSQSFLDAKTAVTFARCLVVSCRRGPAIPTHADDSLKVHPQQEHETRHGSMSRTRWTMDGPEEVPLEIEGRRYSTNDEGAPMMCNLVCSAMGRHVHIDYCRANDGAACNGNEELQHMTKRMQPNPDRAKDVLTHNLFWKRSGEQRLGALRWLIVLLNCRSTGFKDPYSREEQANFGKW
jgi:hypothetical protein